MLTDIKGQNMFSENRKNYTTDQEKRLNCKDILVQAEFNPPFQSILPHLYSHI